MNVLQPDIRTSAYLLEIENKLGPSTQSLEEWVALLSDDNWVTLLSDTYIELPEDKFCDSLYELKSRFDLMWAKARLNLGSDFARLGKLRSEFAAASIDLVLRYAWKITCRTQRLAETELSGLFVLGLGKLGGFDLNFSSDVDLIAYYDPDIFPVPESKGRTYIANKLLQTMTRFLHPKSGGQIVWRVDWRLRPEASASGLAMPKEAALNFYFFRALPWHRLAMIQARVVAGDKSVGDAFLSELTPFLWRRNLDFRAIEEIGYLKKRINLEHPGLQQERAQSAPILPEITGFNVKLGRGGIREIEFIANGLQLIWGGKKLDLKNTPTLEILDHLAHHSLLQREEADFLTESYIVLRRLEDVIQMMDNAQTHIVPGAGRLNQIVSLLGVTQKELSDNIYNLRLGVNAIFESYFHLEDNQKNDVSASLDISSIKTQKGKDIAQSWLDGFDRHGLKSSDFIHFQPLGRTCLDYVINRANNPDDALTNIDQFLRRSSRSGQYFRLLEQRDELFAAIMDPLLYSPHMTRLLEQSPHIIDNFLDPQSPANLRNNDLNTYKPDTSFVLANYDYEARLESLRRLVNENLFAFYHAFLNEGPAEQLQSQLTLLAQTTLETAMQIVADNLELNDLPMAVLALGKMGTGHMAPMSDLDLIFIFDDTVDDALSAKIVRRLKTVITTPLREGIAYELDMRLRPSGRSGPPAVKLSSFTDYHASRAKTWEHLALCSAKTVAGPENLCMRIEQDVAAILKRPRDTSQCLQDAKKMWSLIETQRIEKLPDEIINSKLALGGLMQAEFTRDTHSLLGRPSEGLNEAINFWRAMQIWERLLGLTGRSVEDIPDRFKASVFKSFGVNSAPELIAIIGEIRSGVLEASQNLFSQLEVNSDGDDKPIIWL